jgi:hypothetical protein
MVHGGKRAGAGRKFGVRNKLTANGNVALTVLAQAYTEEMLDILVSLARSSDVSPSARARAAEAVLDRGNGKPTQTTAMVGPAGGPVVIRVPAVEPDSVTWQKRHAPK